MHWSGSGRGSVAEELPDHHSSHDGGHQQEGGSSLKRPRSTSSERFREDALLDLGDFFEPFPGDAVFRYDNVFDQDIYITDATPDHCSVLAQRLEAMAQASEGCDLYVYVGGSTLMLHSCIAAANSPVLKAAVTSDRYEPKSATLHTPWQQDARVGKSAAALLRSPSTEHLEGLLQRCSKGIPCEVNVVDQGFQDLELWYSLRRYMYTGVLSIPGDKNADALRYADKLRMKPLVHLCVNRLVSRLNVDNALDTLQTALDVHSPELQSRTLQFIDIHFDKIARGASPTWCSLSPPAMQLVLLRDTIHTAREVCIFLAVADWALSCNGNESTLNQRLEYCTKWVQSAQCIRLRNMSREDLIEMSQHALVSKSKTIRRAMYDEAMSRVNSAKLESVGARRYEASNLDVVQLNTVLNEDERGKFSVSSGTQTLPLHEKAICAVAVYKDFIISGSADSIVRVFDTHTWDLRCTLEGHAQAVVALKLVDGDRLVSASADRTIRVWSLISWRCVRVLASARSSICSLAVLGTKLISGADDGTIKAWGTKNWALQRTVDAHSHVVWALAGYGTDTLISGSSDTTIRVWDFGQYSVTLVSTLTEHKDEVQALIIDTARGWLISGSDDGVICIHDCEKWTCLKKIESSNRAVLSLLSHDSFLVAGLGNGAITLWELDRILEPGGASKTLKEHTSCVMALAVFRGQLVSGSYDRMLKLWANEK